jgi:hypothetical protein
LGLVIVRTGRDPTARLVRRLSTIRERNEAGARAPASGGSPLVSYDFVAQKIFAISSTAFSRS